MSILTKNTKRNYLKKNDKKKTMKVYIIRETLFGNYSKCLKDFHEAQLFLKRNGFIVMNPLNPLDVNRMYMNKKSPNKTNLKRLFASDAVFILPDVTRTGDTNIELKIAFELDLFIFMSFSI